MVHEDVRLDLYKKDVLFVFGRVASKAQSLEGGEWKKLGLFAREPKTFGGVPWESRIDKELGKPSGFSIGPNKVR